MTISGSSRSLGKRKQKLPSYLLHQASGQARTIIDGRTIYLGEYGSEESRRRYGEVIAEHSCGVRVDPFAKSGGASRGTNCGITSAPESLLTINELVNCFMKHAGAYYVKNGQKTAEYDCFKSAVKPMVNLYGSTPAAEFGPLALKAVRQSMVDGGKKCRSFINKSVGRIKAVFRWAVENEMVEPSVLQKLEAVPPLLAGRTEAKDHAPRRPVSEAHIDAVRKLVREEIRDLIDLQLLTGARSGELLQLTSDMIDRSGKDVWLAKLVDHKTAHLDKERVLVFGPKAKLILAKYITLAPGISLFSCRRDSYGRAVTIACDTAKIARWTPHWLRHNAASRLREEYGLDVAQVMLGHSTADMTALYAHLNLTKAVKAAKEAG